MGKTKRQRKNKKFRFNVNKKRLNKARKGTGTAAAGVPVVKNAWEDRKSVRDNLTSMGLAFDPNVSIKIPKAKDLLKPLMAAESVKESLPSLHPDKAHVAHDLESEAKAPREKKFALPSSQVLWLTYLLDKYRDDYQAMARDSKNIYQETWKQIRNKIRTFQSIPKQWNAYLATRADSESLDSIQ